MLRNGEIEMKKSFLYCFFGCNNLKNVYYNATADEWDKISIGSYNETLVNATIHCIQVKYRLNDITIKDMSGKSLQTIPTGMFLATVSFSNVDSNEDTLIVLTQYTEEGALENVMYIQAENVPTGSIIKLSIPVNNLEGNVSTLKAFCWEDFGSVTPMGNSISFQAKQ